jgi:hypothetical protein
MRSWDGHAQYSLHRHRMAAITPVMEEATGAMPLTIVVSRGVDVILASERRLEASELDSLWFFRVTLGFRNLVDHTRIHLITLLII